MQLRLSAVSQLQRKVIYSPGKDDGTAVTELCGDRNVRTSQGTFIARREDKQGVLAWMEDKIASLTGIPASHGEVCC